ncbi:hypothetical protein ATEIFO6365_0012000400 [Aspergillus terreus]|uniref:Uncharacterized protein n=1 Tax=Aspergillus terreus TaxID=33178 RepID=A0A5M3ZE33_ASPTE|nr:hypothetical protein ATETN484_0013001400 [Aspergillus terreus]GFF20248.1 hypothetical protein ATEIFO6365_0012000400 [Aspergillus terreus]
MSGFDRRSHESNDTYIMSQQLALPVPYSHGDSHDFAMNESGPYHFSTQAFSSYTSQFTPSYGHAAISPHTQHLAPHHSPAHSVPSTPDHPGLHQSLQYASPPRYLQSPRYLPLRDALGSTEIESQDSRNENTMLSEPVVPPLDGFPNVREFDQLMKSYVEDLSVKKQDKALIHAKRARNIRTVLLDPKDTAVESAQFRFWVKKMFKLQTVGTGNSECTKMICHEGKPVAVREKLFKILTRAHQQCQHGGRDKTSAQVRQIYSWVPKELISRFVKICPTCQVRRGGPRLTPPNSRRSSPRLDMVPRSPKLPSPPMSRRDSTLNGQMALERSQADYFGQFSGHGSWMDSQRNIHERPTPLNMASVRTLGAGSMTHLSASMAATMDSFAGDMSLATSHVGYGAEYEPTHGTSGHRDF